MNFDLPLLGDHRILIQNLFFDTESQYLQYVDDMSMKSIILNQMQLDYQFTLFLLYGF